MPDNITQTSLFTPTVMEYPIPKGVHAIPPHLLETRPDAETDQIILHPPSVTSEKNAWFYWHSGYATMPSYTKRNIRAWHRRFSPSGWTIRVLDSLPDSPNHISQYLDTSSPSVFPEALINQTMDGTYAIQHTSDLVRWPLLLKYGGVYADVGLLQIGDLDLLWNTTVGNPTSLYKVFSFTMGGPETRMLANYFMGARKGNEMFERCHRLFLKVWEGRNSTEGLYAHPLLEGVPMMEMQEGFSWTDEKGVTHDYKECGRLLTDYILQGRVWSAVMGLVDEKGGWDGPRYTRENVYGMEYMVGSQWINELTGWDSKRQFELMSLKLPQKGEEETADQAEARRIVEECLSKSFSFKLATGLIVKFFGPTLSSMWRQHDGSDDVPGTYAHWLRYGMANWTPNELMPHQEWKDIPPFRRGSLLQSP